MRLSRRSLSVIGALTVGSVPFVLALSLRGQPPPAALRNQSASGNETGLQMARLLDSIAQNRFASAQMVVFGVSRMANDPSTRQHISSMSAENPAEAATLAKISSNRRDYLVAFLHCASVPRDRSQASLLPLPGQSVVFGSSSQAPPVRPQISSQFVLSAMRPAPASPYLTPIIAFHHTSSTSSIQQMISRQQRALVQAQKALPLLEQGHQISQTADGGWALLLSPIRVSSDACLGCHIGAKRGDTLGVMVYAVSNTVYKD